MRYSILLLLAVISCATPTTENQESTTPASGPMPLEQLLTFDSEQSLKQAFGDSSISRETRYCPEGECQYMATILFKDQPNEAEFMWDDTTNFSGLSTVAVYGAGTWKTSYGLGLGTTMKELETLNGGPISFAGFGWDYGGIVSWDNGRLDTLKGTVVLDMPLDVTHPEADSLMGDHANLRSDQRIPQEINPIVHSIKLRKRTE